MSVPRSRNYYVYITTNLNRTVVYTGVTNNLKRRLSEHRDGVLTNYRSFAAKYNCTHLVYFERFDYIIEAIKREKQIKGWRRSKKNDLINSINPDWDFLENNLEL